MLKRQKKHGAVYFRIIAFSYIPMAVSNILSSWLRCKEHATIPFLASFGAVVVNTGLNYLLIFGKFGFSCMGIKGYCWNMVYRNSTVSACGICIQVGNCRGVYITYHGGIIQACCIVNYL